MTLIVDTPPALRLRPIPVREPGPAHGLPPHARDEAPEGQLLLPFQAVAPIPPVTARAGAAPGDAREWAVRFSQVALEVAAGLRPPAQLVRWTTPAVIAALGRHHALAQRGGGRPPRATVRSVRLCEPVPGVGEVTAVVAAGPRVRALAFRMEDEGGRWRVVAFELG
jgi:Family of unknown function (DUF6459)